jgi:hypothetical protein
MSADFEVVQHLAARTHRHCRRTVLPALRREMLEAQKIVASGHSWSPQARGQLVSGLAEVSGLMEQLAMLEHWTAAQPERSDKRVIINALKEAQHDCHEVEAAALKLLSRAS